MPSKKTALAIPANFKAAAMAYPDKVRQIIATIDHPADAQKALAETEVLAKYAKQLKVDTETVNAIQYGRLLLIAKLGSMMPKGKGGRGKKNLLVDQVGLGRSSIDAYRKVFANADRIDEYYEAVDRALDEVTIRGLLDYISTGNVTRHGCGNSSIEWYTPSVYIEKARRTMGGIDLDPASCKSAQATVKADTFYTQLDDGLEQNWIGRVFLNPPYKMPDVANFACKLCDSVEDKIISQAVLLTNNSTDTNWWQRAVGMASVVCLTNGRISFVSDNNESSSPTNGQSFCYFGNRAKTFVKEFADVGACVRSI